METAEIKITGMTCINCQGRIEKKLATTVGISHVVVSYAKEMATISFDSSVISFDEIKTIIENLGYGIASDTGNKPNKNYIAGTILIIFAFYLLLRQFDLSLIFNSFPLAKEGMGYMMIFVIGLFTSVHCIAMCGGINISQCMPKVPVKVKSSKFSIFRSSFLYNLGRVIAYTVVGAIVGGIGSVISFSGNMKGIVQIVAGIFMVIMGINMLGIFGFLRKFNIRMPRFFADKIEKKEKSTKSPFYIGLLNGLMPCGPLQAMQLLALSTGDPIKGAISMFIFSLGTVPLMFLLGTLSSVLSKKFTNKILKVGAILVIILGMTMFLSGWSLSGFSIAKSGAKNAVASQVENEIQIVTTTLSSGRYEAISVKAGIPVKWIINAPKGSINGCNNRIIIPEYGIEYQFHTGENIIEFIPIKKGTFQYTCWMGMIRSKIIVE